MEYYLYLVFINTKEGSLTLSVAYWRRLKHFCNLTTGFRELKKQKTKNVSSLSARICIMTTKNNYNSHQLRVFTEAWPVS